MKAQLVSSRVVESSGDFVHDEYQTQTLIYIPEARLAIPIGEKQVYCFFQYDSTGDEVLRNIDVPDSLVTLAESKKDIDEKISNILRALQAMS